MNIIMQANDGVVFGATFVMLAFFGLCFYAYYWWTQHLEDRTLQRDITRIKAARNIRLTTAQSFNRLKRIVPRARLVETRHNCPACGESIPTVAKFCRFCNTDFTQQTLPSDTK